MTDWAAESDAQDLPLEGLRNRFYALTIRADRQTLQIVHDVYSAAVQNFSIADRHSVFLSSLAFQPVPKSFFETPLSDGGNPQGVDTEDAPYIMIEEAITFNGSITSADVTAFHERTHADIVQTLSQHGLKPSSFLYINDADSAQQVFRGYPADNVRLLKTIRARYDPDRVFTNLMYGGWKVDG